jgi:hypothetical protein
LFEEQAAKRKGSKEAHLPNQILKPIYRKLVTFEEIRILVKEISFYLLESEIET